MSSRRRLTELRKPDNLKLSPLSHFISEGVRFLRLIGCHPIHIRRFEGCYIFEFKALSLITLYTIVNCMIGSIVLVNWLIILYREEVLQKILEEYYKILQAKGYISHLRKGNETLETMGKLHYEKLDGITKACLKLVAFCMPVSTVYYAFASLSSTSTFLKLLNGATKFEIKCRKTFPMSVLEMSLIKLIYYRRRVMIANLILIAFVILIQIPILYLIFSTLIVTESTLFKAMFMFTESCSIGIFDDTKVLLVLKIVHEHFAQIVDGIKLHKEEKHAIYLDTIKPWRCLIFQARRQSKLAVASIQQSSTLLLMALYIILTSSTYLIYRSLDNDYPDVIAKYSVVALVFASSLYLRVHAKATLAENITKKEDELAEIFRIIEVRTPVDTKYSTAVIARKLNAIEISFIIDPIKARPTECRLGNTVALNLQLLFGIFREVSTYSVALIQLQANFGGNPRISDKSIGENQTMETVFQ